LSFDVNSRKWLHEEVLQRYIKENPQKWKINGKKVLSIRYNETFDKYPDLWFRVDGEKNEIPVEVEWTSKDFDHDVNYLKERNGKIFLLIKNMEDERIGVEQIEIPKIGFQKWFKSSAETLFENTLSLFENYEIRKTPKLWIKYISKRGGDVDDYKKYGHRHTAGIPTKAPAVKEFKKVQKDDLIMFVIEGSGFNARSPPKKWHQASFTGKFQRIEVFRVTSDYYDANTTGESNIWGINAKGDTFPHRFKFDETNNDGKTPLLKLKDLKVNELSPIAIEQLRKVVSVNFVEGDYATLVECIFHSKQDL
jgi:hypothetical protein